MPPSRVAGQDVWNASGPCIVEGDCIASPHFPGSYGPSEECAFSVLEHGWLNVTAFDTEAGWDVLQVGGSSYSGTQLRVPRGGEVGPNTSFVWASDSSVQGPGWQLCLGQSVSDS